MNFTEQYNSIKSVIKCDFSLWEQEIAELFCNKSQIDKPVLKILTAPSKRLRPLTGFLFLRAENIEITTAMSKVLLAVELIHNASFIHDDVIDEAEQRRGEDTLNNDFSSNLAVVAGDYVLSLALEKIVETNSVEVSRLFAKAMQGTCLGEVNQYFSKYNVGSINDYVEKSRKKTAILFKLSIIACLELCPKISSELKHRAEIFAEKFGLAFQIRDDLINFLDSENMEKSDLSQGIYTAPVIFATENYSELLTSGDIFNQTKTHGGVEKTKVLMDNYFENAQNAISDVEESVYKKSLTDVINLLKTSVKNE